MTRIKRTVNNNPRTYKLISRHKDDITDNLNKYKQCENGSCKNVNNGFTTKTKSRLSKDEDGNIIIPDDISKKLTFTSDNID